MLAPCFTLTSQNETTIRVTFILTSPALPNHTAVYITGSVEQLGTWNPSRVKMDRQGNHRWTKEISINRPLSIEYKYTLGPWEREGADANGSPLSNLVVAASQDKTVKTQSSSGLSLVVRESTTAKSLAQCDITAR